MAEPGKGSKLKRASHFLGAPNSLGRSFIFRTKLVGFVEEADKIRRSLLKSLRENRLYRPS
jgi:hypothetical protein